MIVTSPSTDFASFQVAHGLGAAPAVPPQINMTSGGAIWLDATLPYDATYVYLHASDAGLTAILTFSGYSVPSPGGYCSITDVTNAFPSFQRNAPGSIQDAQIESWISIHAIRIRAALVQRGADPGSPNLPGWPAGSTLPSGLALSADQVTFLQGLNADMAIGELGRALEGNVTLQPGEISLISGRRRNYEAVLEDIRKGRYDAFFSLQSRLWGSTGGAETGKSTPGQRGENRAFGRNQEF